MAIQDQLTTLKSSLDSIKTALSNKGVSTSGSLTADQVSSKISSINTNQSTTKNMGSQSVTFQEKLYKVSLEIATNLYQASQGGGATFIESGYIFLVKTGFTIPSSPNDLPSKVGSGNYYRGTVNKYSENKEGAYSSATNVLNAYKTYKSSGKWPTVTTKVDSKTTYPRSRGIDIEFNVPPGSYQLAISQTTSASMYDISKSYKTITVNSSNITQSFGIHKGF